MSKTKSDLVDALRNELAVSNIEARQFLDIVFNEITDSFKRGYSVHLPRFGNFVLIKKGKRVGRNPRSGEEITIEPRCVVSFRPSRKLKNQINNNVGSQ